MTYLQFLIIFLGLPLIFAIRFYRKSNLPHKTEFFWGIAVLVFLAVSYTTPWDNYLVMTNVWTYGPDRVLGTIGYVPVEEYGFFVLQTILTGLWCFYLQKSFPLKKSPAKSPIKLFVTILYFALFGLGVYGLFVTEMRYLGLILAWAMPVLILQWVLGGQYLINNAKIFITSFMVPTVYFWFADGLAIYLKIWDISTVFTIGWGVGPLPLEEATFFLITNLMVAQGLILFVVMEELVGKALDFKRKLIS